MAANVMAGDAVVAEGQNGVSRAFGDVRPKNLDRSPLVRATGPSATLAASYLEQVLSWLRCRRTSTS